MIWRFGAILVALMLLWAGAEAAWRGLTGHPPAPPAPLAAAAAAAAPTSDKPGPAKPAPVIVPPAATRQAAEQPTLPLTRPAPAPPCAAAPAFAKAAQANAASVTGAAWSVFGRIEPGWQVYAVLTAHEIGTACTPDQPGFAKALADWQGPHGLMPNGIMDLPTLKALDVVWQRRRPFVAASRQACPPPPADFRLALANPAEGYLKKPIELRPGTLGAYRKMVEAAHKDVPAMAADDKLLTIFSGYRDPLSDAARCASQGNCGTAARAFCSAHRTGLAMDVYLGSAPGFPPDSSADPNRLFMTQTPLYRWMVANAARFGFVNYPFEPWHWEWTGEPVNP